MTLHVCLSFILLGCLVADTPDLPLRFILEDVTDANANAASAHSQEGMDLLADGRADEAARAFRAALDCDETLYEAHHGLIRALRDAGRLEQSIAAALALIALTPYDPLAHTALSISLQTAGHIEQAEAASARARILEWKVQLQSPENAD